MSILLTFSALCFVWLMLILRVNKTDERRQIRRKSECCYSLDEVHQIEHEKTVKKALKSCGIETEKQQ